MLLEGLREEEVLIQVDKNKFVKEHHLPDFEKQRVHLIIQKL